MQSIAITVALALLGLGNSTGQENGSVSGRAVLRDGSLARGVTVTATAGSVRRRVVTGVSGDFRLDSLPPDSYRIEGDLEGFRTAVEAITVSAGAEAEVTLVMRLGISGDIDYVLPADGLRGALRAADVVVHLRIITSLGSGLLGPDETLLATQHAATVLRVIKCPQPSVAAGERIQFWQHMAGAWREEGRLTVGPRATYAIGDEFVAFLEDDTQWGGRAELAGPHLMLPVIDGVVRGIPDAADGLRAGMQPGEFLDVLQRLQ